MHRCKFYLCKNSQIVDVNENKGTELKLKETKDIIYMKASNAFYENQSLQSSNTCPFASIRKLLCSF